MTYKPRTLAPHEAAAAAYRHELIPWRAAAQLAQVKPATVARWIDRGHLPYITVEGVRRVDLAHVTDLEHARRDRLSNAGR